MWQLSARTNKSSILVYVGINRYFTNAVDGRTEATTRQAIHQNVTGSSARFACLNTRTSPMGADYRSVIGPIDLTKQLRSHTRDNLRYQPWDVYHYDTRA